MKRTLKIFLPIALLVVVVSGTIAGVALAQGGGGSGGSQSGQTTARDQFMGFLATRLGVSQDQLTAAFKGAGNDMVDQALSDGKITQAQADNIRQRIENGQVFGPGLFCGKGRGEALTQIRNIVNDVASTLKLTPLEIMTQMKDGKSLAEIASAQGVSRDDLKSAITTSVGQALDNAVSNGKLTQDQATQAKDKLSQNLDKIIDWKRGADASQTPQGQGMWPNVPGTHRGLSRMMGSS